MTRDITNCSFGLLMKAAQSFTHVSNAATSGEMTTEWPVPRSSLLSPIVSEQSSGVRNVSCHLFQVAYATGI
jgi:hypothetical protein